MWWFLGRDTQEQLLDSSACSKLEFRMLSRSTLQFFSKHLHYFILLNVTKIYVYNSTETSEQSFLLSFLRLNMAAKKIKVMGVS